MAMTERIITPTGRGFLLLDAHPAGCIRSVEEMRAQVPPGARSERPVALIIGSSSGYGLATTIAGLAGFGVQGVGIAFERPPGRRTATAGWYRTIATASIARDLGAEFSFVNGDAFSDAVKDEVLDTIAKRFGGVDVLVYSVAAPRRTDPATGLTHSSVIKPLGKAHTTRTLDFSADGVADLRDITVEPATESESYDTVRVMGGDDWARWIAVLAGRGLLRPGFRTVALSYIGSSLTSAIYRSGTIGAAKEHLERTAGTLTGPGVRALTSVNGAAVTQASTAIPGIALYVSLLRAVLGEAFQSPIEQSVRLWSQLTGDAPMDLDEQGRLRLDRWELDDAVQEQIRSRWLAATPETIGDLADIAWFRQQFRSLYGFDVPGIDYTQPVDPDLDWPS
jgi:enoyl-[acyl-carrier protein] reductase / trans-2-enoyl-CoA reductase (NAD+)